MINPVIIKSNKGGTKATSPNATNYSNGGSAVIGGDYLPATAITSELNGVEETDYYLIDNNTKHIKSITYQIPATVVDEEGNESILVDESGNTIYRDFILINENGIKVDEYKVVTEEWFYRDDSGNIHCRFNLIGDKEVASYGMGSDSGETIVTTGVTIVDNLESSDSTKALSANQGRVLDEKLKELSGKTSLHKLDDVFVEPELLEDGLVLTYDANSQKWIAKKSELQSGITEEKISQWDSAYTHTQDSTVHVNEEEKKNWNKTFDTVSGIDNLNLLSSITQSDITNWDNASNKAHEHSNKDVLDGISQSDVNNWNTVYDDWNDGFYYDENGNLHARVNLVGDKEISAYGKGDSTTGGIITIVDNLQSELTDAALSARQGKVLKEMIDSKKVDIDLSEYYKKSEVDSIVSGKSDVNHSHEWDSIKNKPTTFNPSEHNHPISGITNLQSELNKKVNNSTFNSHSGNTTIHITSDERTKWNNAVNKAHSHGNKSVLDTITSTKVSNWDNVYLNWNKAFYYDDNGYIHVKINMIGDEEVSAYGSGNSTSTGAITIIDSLTSNATDAALSANQGRILKELIDSKTVDVNLSEYYKKNEIDNILKAYASSSHTHTISNITGLQSALDGKASSSHTHNQYSVNGHTHAISAVTNLQSSLNAKADSSALTSHTSNSTVHITSSERTNWNNAFNKAHTHSNKTVIDGISSSNITNWNTAYSNSHTHANKAVLDGISSTDVSNWNAVYDDWIKAFYFDSNGNLKAKVNIIGECEISAYGQGNTSSSGIITIVDNLTSTDSNSALSANQGRVLKSLIDSKTVDVDLSSYYKKNEIDTILKSYASSAHTHTIANVSGLQSALDGKSSTAHTHSQYSLTSHTHHYSAITALVDVLATKSNTGHTHAWNTITNKPTTFTPSEHDHEIADVNGLQTALNNKAASSALTSHTSNSTIHVTSDERKNWNVAYNNSHSHSNKTVLDGISSTKVSNWDSVYSNWNKGFYFDTDGNLRVKVNLVGDKEISAYGSGSTSNSGLITIVDNLTSTASDAALSANQGRVLKNLIDTKTIDLSNYYNKGEIDNKLSAKASSSHTHAISAITNLQSTLDGKSGTGHTHSNYSLTSHTHSNYSVTSHTHTWNTITDKPSSFTPSEHNHAISAITGLQTALNAKAATSALTSHTSNTTVHITADERKNWNVAYTNNHTHSNKSVLDGISATKVSNWDSVYSDWNKGFYYDSNGNLRVKLNLIGEKEISAYGAGSSSSSGLVTIVDNLTSTASDAALSANQGRVLKNLIDTKTIDLSNYYNKSEIDTKLSSKASSAHTHAISAITNLQSTLDGKSSTAHTHSNYSLTSHTHSNYSLTGHTHSISNVTGLQSALDDKFSASVTRTANTVLAAPNGSSGTASFRKLVAEDLPTTVRNFTEFDITYQDYAYFVIGLYCITDTYTGGGGNTSQGTVYIARTGGANWSVNAEYVISNKYSSSTASTTNQKVKFSLREMVNDSSLKPCTFIYNGKKYAGLAWTEAPSPYKLRIMKAFAQCTPFFVRYFNTSSGNVINSEIYNSIRINDTDIDYGNEWLFGNLRLLNGNVSANTFIGAMGSSFSFTKNGTTYSYNGTEAKSLNLDNLNYLPLSGGTLGSTTASSTWLNLNSSTAKLMMCAYSDGINYIESVNASNTGNVPLTLSGKGGNNGSTLNLSFNTITTRGQYTNIDSGNYNSYAPSLTGGGASGTWGINVSGYAGALYKTNHVTNLNSPIWGITDGYSINYNNCDSTVSNAPSGIDNANLIMNIQHGKHNTSGMYGWQVGFFHNLNAPYVRKWTGGRVGSWIKLLTSGNYNEFAPAKDGTGASGTWGISVSGNAATATKLKNYYSSRPSNANITQDGSGGMCKFLATSTMTSNKPTVEGHILHLFWDNTGGWDAQLMIPNNGNASYEPQWRGQNNGTWGNWISLVTSGTIKNYNAGSATKLQTARTLWGQSFDGTANISGAMTGVTSITTNGSFSFYPVPSDKTNYFLTWGGNSAPFTLHNYGQITFETSTGYKFNGSAGINVSGNSITAANFKLQNDASSPYLQLGGWYTQIYSSKMYLGNGRAKSLSIDANGNVVSVGDLTAYSDRRLKSDIKPLNNRGYITPVTYIKDNKQSIGFIAQEVQQLYPELVIEDNNEEKYLSLNYAQYTAVLQAQIIEQSNVIQELKKEIEELKKLIQN